MHNCKRCGKQFKWDQHYQNHNQRVNPCKDKRTEIKNMDEDKIIIIQKIFRGFLVRRERVIRILKNIEWLKIIEIYNIFGESLNDNDMKFMKGKLYEIFITTSDKNFIHVDQDGYDITCLGIKIECKFEQELLLTKKKRELKANPTYKFKNTQGDNKHKILISKTANIYIMMQRDAVGYTEGYNVWGNIRTYNDGIKSKIPKENINLLYNKTESVEINKDPEFNLSKIISDIYTCICISIWNNLDWKIELKECLYNIADNL